jgi:hypothetical protein
MVQKYHYMLMPAFIVQRNLRERMYHNHHVNWGDEERRRKTLGNVSVLQIIEKIDQLEQMTRGVEVDQSLHITYDDIDSISESMIERKCDMLHTPEANRVRASARERRERSSQQKPSLFTTAE